MTLIELKNEIDRLLKSQSENTETTVDDLVVREAGGWRYIDVVANPRGIESAADSIDAMQRRIVHMKQ